MANKVKFSETRDGKKYKELLDDLIEVRLARANFLQRLILKRLIKKDPPSKH